MDDWNRFDEEQLPNKSDFYSGLNMEEITGIDYRHAEKVFNKFNIKNLGIYHDLYVQSDTYFKQMFLKILETCAKKFMD